MGPEEGHDPQGLRLPRDQSDLAPVHRAAADGDRSRRPDARSKPTAPWLASASMRVLLTNDDGIEALGLQSLRRALLEVPQVELAVIAPDGNRSAMARSITTRRPLWVQEVDFG